MYFSISKKKKSKTLLKLHLLLTLDLLSCLGEGPALVRAGVFYRTG